MLQQQFDHSFIYSETTEKIQIDVEAIFIPEKSSIEKEFYFFAYHVKMTNLGTSPVKLLNRQWIIRDGKKRERYIHGEGVIGQRPILEPSKSFEYTSSSSLSTPTGNMRGKYEFTNNDGENFWVKIPLFFLNAKANATIH